MFLKLEEKRKLHTGNEQGGEAGGHNDCIHL